MLLDLRVLSRARRYLANYASTITWLQHGEKSLSIGIRSNVVRNVVLISNFREEKPRSIARLVINSNRRSVTERRLKFVSSIEILFQHEQYLSPDRVTSNISILFTDTIFHIIYPARVARISCLFRCYAEYKKKMKNFGVIILIIELWFFLCKFIFRKI